MLDSPDDDEINDEHFDDFNDDDDYEGSKKWYNSQWVQFIKPTTLSKFLATLVALHLTPVSQSVAGQSFKTSVASRLASLFNDMKMLPIINHHGSNYDVVYFAKLEQILKNNPLFGIWS